MTDRRGAWLDIDLGAIRHNIALIRSVVGDAAVAAVQQAAGYDDRIDRAVGGHCGGGGTNAVLVSEVAFEILDPGCGRSGRLPV